MEYLESALGTLAFDILNLVFLLKLISSEWSQIVRDGSNELTNTHKIPTYSQCNDKYRGSCGKF